MMFSVISIVEQMCPGITEAVRSGMMSIFTQQEVQEWLQSMARCGVHDIHVYTTVDQPYCTMRDLMELDDLLAERRILEYTTLGKCQDMHPHYEAAFLFVNAGRASGIHYTLADYGRKVKWGRELIYNA